MTNSPEAANQQTKTQTPAKTAKTVTASKKKAAIGPDEEVFTGDQIDTGNVKVRNGVIETPDVYIDENGIRRKIPGVRIPQPPIDSPTFRYLTPEQREKLKMLNRKDGRTVVPKPTPQQEQYAAIPAALLFMPVRLMLPEGLLARSECILDELKMQPCGLIGFRILAIADDRKPRKIVLLTDKLHPLA